jgi:hypothetical protein
VMPQRRIALSRDRPGMGDRLSPGNGDARRPNAAHPAVRNVLRRITAGQRALVSRYVTLFLLSARAAMPMVSHLILESRFEIKIEKARLPGASLRNRTVDLLLTMHACSV